MRGALPVIAVVFAIVAAGCVDRKAPSASDEDAPAEPAPVVVQALADVPDWRPDAEPPLAKRQLDVSLALQEAWVRPRQPFDASVTAPAGSNVTWFVSTRGSDAFAELIGDYYYVGGANSPFMDAAHRHGPPTHPAVDTGSIDVGQSTRPYSFGREGRYVLGLAAAPHAQLNLTVDARAPPRDVAHVTVVEDGHGLRISPSELLLHPSTRVRFWNVAPISHAVVEQRFLATFAREAPMLKLIAVDPGEYEILGVAREGPDAWGEAAARLVIDFGAPSARLFLGPYTGRVSSIETPGAVTLREHTFVAAHPLRSLSFELDVGSAAPVPVDVAWTIAHEDETLFEGTHVDAEAHLVDVPAGNITISVRANGGVAIDYSLLGEGRNRLAPPTPPPDR